MTQVILTSYRQLQNHLGKLRLHWRLHRAVEGVLLALVLAGVMVLLAGVVDQQFALSQAVRWMLWGLMVLVVLAQFGRGVLLPLVTRHSDAYFAALAESRHGGLENRLINAVQVGDPKRDVAGASGVSGASGCGLVEAIVADGLEALGSVRARVVTSGPVLVHGGAAFLGALILWVLWLWFGGPGASVAAQRVAAPWQAMAPFTWTKLALTPVSSVRVLEDEPLGVTVRWRGRSPVSPQLHWQGGDSQWRAVPLSPVPSSQTTDTSHTLAYRFAAVRGAMTVYATGGDGVSERLAVTIAPRPRVASLQAIVIPPAYTEQPATTINLASGQLAILPGSSVQLQLGANLPLKAVSLEIDGNTQAPLKAQGSDGVNWSRTFGVKDHSMFRVRLIDRAGHDVVAPEVYSVRFAPDAAPLVNIQQPGRDTRLTSDQKLDLRIIARDDYGLGQVQLMARRTGQSQPRVVATWPQKQDKPQREVTITASLKAKDFELNPGQSLQYWAQAEDRNNVHGPGVGQSQHYTLSVLSPEQFKEQERQAILDYSRYVGRLLEQQKTNLTQTLGRQPAGPLSSRENDIRVKTLALIEDMVERRFQGQTIITQLSELASQDIVRVIGVMDSAAAATDLALSNTTLQKSVTDQQHIIKVLEEILIRLDRNEAARKKLQNIQKKSPKQYKQIVASLDKIKRDLDQFLLEQKQLDKNYEKMPKRDSDEANGNAALTQDPDHRADRWKKWTKGAIDDLAKLPSGFAKDTHLADTLSTIFEEIEKKPTLPTREIATPLEEGAKWQGTQIKEDLEMWMPDRGDSIKWTMEDPAEGKFDVPEATLPDELQDMVGDLIEDATDFDQDADDTTGAWGGNTPQAGWDIADGPISSFAATGKTGNQLPNNSEITGRSGAGRRGKATGQMVGSDSSALEGRPTPARVTNERYEKGQIDAKSQLDPRGSTGGGKKTGGGAQGLQGGTPPDMVKDMARLDKNQKMIREKSQQLADALRIAGRSSSRVDQAMALFDESKAAMRDKRYQDAALKRKLAIGELRGQQQAGEHAISLSLDRAHALPDSMRQEIAAGARQALPEGYQDMVGAYYRALTEASNQSPLPPAPAPETKTPAKIHGTKSGGTSGGTSGEGKP